MEEPEPPVDTNPDTEADGAGGPIPGMPPMPAMAPEEDQVAGPSSDKLLGLHIDYRYSGGRHYTLTFDHDFHVTFAMPDSPMAGSFQAPSLSYRAREIRPDMFLVHWIVKPAAIHVALTVDLAESRLHVAAMMPPNRWEFFDTATILATSRA